MHSSMLPIPSPYDLGLFGQQIRLWRPGASSIFLEVEGKIESAERQGDLFVYTSPQPLTPISYRIYHQNGLLAHDPYAFPSSVGEMDLFLFGEGKHYRLYEFLGAQFLQVLGVYGVRFCVWAPNARNVSWVSGTNFFDGRLHPMRPLGVSGVWELFVPGIEEGEKYKFEITTMQGDIILKSDPMAFYTEMRPNTASVTAKTTKFSWTDAPFLERRGQGLLRPIHIYEVHLGSWRRFDGGFPGYRKLGEELALYCQEMGFTHVELLPIMEHPFDPSWGYQVTHFYAVTSRYGYIEDFQWMVNHLHEKGIGVLLDWVPGHFPQNTESLAKFDGTYLYEHQDPRQGLHPHWGTAIFNYGRKEVANFLLANALFWCDIFHIDGLRFDAVASMLYLDYGRNPGEWIPNKEGGNWNLEAIAFLVHVNQKLQEHFPSVLTIAEESSAFPQVTAPNGLGFTLKWNMGWMNDTLSYFRRDPIYRCYHQNDLTFSLCYAFSEKFLLPLSHDEVVHGKGSLLSKMPGDDWQKFANLRLLYSYMMGHPGKKLLFMGGELAQWSEWKIDGQIDWYLLQYAPHRGMHQMVRDLNHFCLHHPSMWQEDHSWEGYSWVDFSDHSQGVISYLRKSAVSPPLLWIHHFTPTFLPEYGIRIGPLKRAEMVFHTDKVEYGGSGKIGGGLRDGALQIELPPLASVVFEVEFL